MMGYILGLTILRLYGVGRLLDGSAASRPVELVNDGDLVLLIERMLQLRELDTVRISKVKGHADEALFRWGSS